MLNFVSFFVVNKPTKLKKRRPFREVKSSDPGQNLSLAFSIGLQIQKIMLKHLHKKRLDKFISRLFPFRLSESIIDLRFSWSFEQI